ncbi:sucrase ferredoxin [Deinococcus radiophilus]|uniref:Sucraseferredoxin family protein n=1 Tax=Deinococcus radiophilus TaxID=32062 RepID=A0A431VUJ9_9DEIO|nr:sucrase ferredoxin [Deinococcus radiophilus]RTR26872.1 sucraseferredoxin family protein [Deinococcus radiophilus]UFA51763.1 sucraseferredoxin family protein [Deinococcus radiophilus]
MPGGAARLPLCADVSRRSGESPHGSAHRWDTCIAFESPVREWDALRDLARMSEVQRRALEGLSDWSSHSGLGYGWLMFAPADPAAFDPTRRRVRVYTRPAGAFAEYRQRDYLADEDALWALFLQYAAGVGVSQAREIAPLQLSDWYLCTHGRVDSACGKYGAALLRQLPEHRLYRTSHFGGHQYAPTLLELPAGRSWGHLTPELTRQLLERSGDGRALAPYYRGWSALPEAAQRADAAAFAQYGWRWLDAPRCAEVSWEGEAGFSVRLQAEAYGAQPSLALEATGERTHVLQLPGSSHSPDLFPAPQYRVTLREVQESA